MHPSAPDTKLATSCKHLQCFPLTTRPLPTQYLPLPYPYPQTPTIPMLSIRFYYKYYIILAPAYAHSRQFFKIRSKITRNPFNLGFLNSLPMFSLTPHPRTLKFE